MLGFPTERVLQLVFAGYQYGGISRAARAELARNLVSRDAFGRIDDFQDGIAAARADVESFAGNAFDVFQRAQMRIGDVIDVNIVPNAGTVRRRVVCAQHIYGGDSPAGGVEDARN